MNPFFEIAINHHRGHKKVAAAAYCGGMRNDHDDIGGLLGLSQLLLAEGSLDAADVLLERAERLMGRPHQHVDFGRGIIAAKQGRYEDAEVRLRKVAAIGGVPDAWLYLGVIRQNAGATGEAIEWFRKAEDAGSDLAKICRAQALLEKGAFAEALDLYDARWETGEVVRPPVALHIRPWRGQPLEGKHLVVYEEQGFGDTIQLFRFIPKLEARGARVTVLVRREMQRLLQAAWPGLVDLIECSMPAADYSLPMFDLLRLADEFDGKPYLEPERYSDFPIVARPRNAKAIGIVWAGDQRHSNDRNRSVPLAQLARLAGIPGVALYSFQMGARAQELETAGFGSFIQDLAPNIRDFADTAALLKPLDLVVSVDTAIVHLCGALGVPCFALIPYERDWRWGPSGETTAWYDSVRLFRQQTTGEWRPVIDDVLKAVGTTLSIDVQTIN